ncbi:MAG: NB-ARC domain-containing protein [Chloroflexota bacterium]
MPFINTAPHPDNRFVKRPEPFEQMKTYLLNQGDQPVALTTAFQGGGGFGKTILAQVLCHDEAVINRFPGGILWFELGKEPNLLELLNNKIQLELLNNNKQHLGGRSFSQFNDAATHLIKQLGGQDGVLFVLDDVWRKADANLFLDYFSDSTFLITTRDQDLTRNIGAYQVPINQMTVDQATHILAGVVPYSPDENEWVLLNDLADFLGCWPLLVNLASGYLDKLIQVDGLTITEATTRLRRRLAQRGFTAFDIKNEDDRNTAISRSLGISLDQLGMWANRFNELAIFPGEVDIPFVTLEHLWAGTANLDDLDTEDARHAMNRLSLFNRYDRQKKTVHLHDVVRAYLIEQQANLPQLQAKFLASYRLNLTDGWADLPSDEPYLWDQLIYHLIASELKEELYKTITDLRYLSHRCYYQDVAAAEADLLKGQEQFPNDEPLTALTRNFINAAHLLDRCQKLNDLQATLDSRLYHVPELKPQVSQFRNKGCVGPIIAQHPLPDQPHPALIRTFSDHSDFVIGCAFSPDGSLILSASYDGTVKMWDVDSGQLLKTFSGHSRFVTDCAFSPDVSRILSASDDKTLKVWGVDSGQLIKTFSGHSATVRSCTFSPNGSLILSASDDKTLKVWDVDSGQLIKTFSGHSSFVIGCAFSPNSSLILSASSDKALKVWDVDSGQLIKTFSGHSSVVTDCAFSPDGSRILSASYDGTVKMWDVNSGQLLKTFSGHIDVVTGCAFSPDGSRILSASDDKTLKVWDVDSGQQLITLSSHSATVRSCAFSPNSSRILSASDDKTLKVWDVDNGQQLITLSSHSATVNGCTFSPNSSRILSASEDRTLKVWDVDSGQQLITFSGHSHFVNSCAFSPDGSRILSASDDKTLKVWDVDSGQLLKTFSGHSSWVKSCAFSPDGSRILSASSDKTLKVWDVDSGQQLMIFSGHSATVRSCAFSPDGSRILSASSDKTLKVWDVGSGQQLMTFSGHSHFVNSCAFSPDGSRILSASYDGSLKVWDVGSGQQLMTFSGHSDWVNDCAFSPDGSRTLSVSDDQTLRVWDVDSRICLATLLFDAPLLTCAWSFNNGEHIVAGGTAGVYFLEWLDPS